MSRFAVLVIFVLMICGCIGGDNQAVGKSNITTKPPVTTSSVNEFTANVKVVEATDKKPISDAIVFLEAGSKRCTTDDEGKCEIRESIRSIYDLSIVKKGYVRKTKKIQIFNPTNFFTLELERLDPYPKTANVRGTVEEHVTLEGTRSENHFIVIFDSQGKKHYILDEIGRNQGFEDIMGKKVLITGYRDKGYVGLQHKEAEGIYVERVKVIEET